MDELARRRAKKHARSAAVRVAGQRRHPPPPEVNPDPGSTKVVIADLRTVEGMVEEIEAEAVAVGDERLSAAMDALSTVVRGALRVAQETLEAEGG